MTVEPSVEALWSIHEIQQLASRYAKAHDSRDLAEMERVFWPADEPLEFPSYNIANIRAFLPGYFDVAGPTMLFVCNHIIELEDADHATGSVYCIAKLELGGAWIEQAILYKDDYRRYEGGWRFYTRRHLLWYGIELPERPFEQPKTIWPASATGTGSLPADFDAWRAWYGTDVPTGYYSQPPLDASSYK